MFDHPSLYKTKQIKIGLTLSIGLFIVLGIFWHQKVIQGIKKEMLSEVSFQIKMVDEDLLRQDRASYEKILNSIDQKFKENEVALAVLTTEQVFDGSFDGYSKNVIWSGSNYQRTPGSLNYLKYQIKTHEQDPKTNSSQGYFWKFGGVYFAASQIGEDTKSYWYIETKPAKHYLKNWWEFWLSYLVLALSLAGVSYFVMMDGLARNFKPLQQMLAGVKAWQIEDYSYDFKPGHIDVINDLGDTIKETSQRLSVEKSDLMVSQKQLALLLENINLGVLVIDSKGKIERFNPAVEKILGFDQAVIGKPYQTIIKSYPLIHLINQVIQTGIPSQEEVEIFLPSAKFIDVNVLTQKESSRSDLSVLVLMYDITQIRKLETVRSEFVANASHELRTPVTAIKGFAETLLSGALEEANLARKFVGIIANESKRLEVIIEDILELSRVEKHNSNANKIRFDIVETARNITDFLDQKIQNKQMTIKFKGDDQLFYTGDKSRIEQVMTNLVDNAINYSEAHSQITFTMKNKKKGVQFTVEDTGIGIPESELDRIFERFYRVDKARSRNSGGTGLGLSIVRNLVKNMGGTIEVESVLGQGTKFIIFLPH